jgi:hypothetical protein
MKDDSRHKQPPIYSGYQQISVLREYDKINRRPSDGDGPH